MSGLDGRIDSICRKKGCDDSTIAECHAESGALKELLFCHRDGCFVVKVNGRERLRSDIRMTAVGYFSNPEAG
jgi:hypothetical protein